MAIQNDFTIYPKTKVIRHTSGTTVYSAVAFYSWLMDTFDEPGYLTYQTPIRFNTPTSFTMINGWFLDDGDGNPAVAADGHILKYLTGGGIDTSGYSTVSDPILMADLASSTAVFLYTDKDKTVKSGTNVGPLLAYRNNYPTSGRIRIWVRDTNSHGALATGTVTEVTTAVGTGSGTTDATTGSVSGDEIYHNLFTIASFPTDVSPQVYIYQRHPVTTQSYNVRVRIAEWSALTNWDRGSIDVLIPVQLGGSLIDSGNIKSFVRQTGDSFTFVESTLNTSGRTPIATETSADEVNITKGETYLLYDGSDTGSFSVDDVISDVDLSAGIPPTWYAEVVAITEFANTTSGILTLRSLRGTIADNDNIYVSNVLEGVANGTPGDTYISYTSGTAPSTAGQVLTGGTSTAKRLQRGIDTTAKKIVAQDDPTNVVGVLRNAYYKNFSSGETVTGATTGSIVLDATSTTLISGYNDITVAHMNGTVVVNTFSGTFIPGEKVTWTGGGPAIMIYTNGTSSMFLGNVADETGLTTNAKVITGAISGATCQTNGTGGMTDDNTQNFEFTLQSTGALYSVFIEGGSIYNAGRSLSDIYAYLQYYLRDGQSASARTIYTSDNSSITALAAEEYIKAATAYSATKPAPFGTLAGTTFFGAQAVWLTGMASADNNNIKLTDSAGVLQQPYTSINLTISNTRSGDRIAVYLQSGSTTLPDKAQYVSHNTLNVQSGSIFDRVAAGGAFPNDTPTSGTFIAVDTSANEEHRYRYTSYTATGGGGTDGHLILATERTGTATSTGSTGQTLIALAATFVTWGIKIGDIIRRANAGGGWAYVISIDSETQVTTTLLSISTGWADTNTFEMLSLVVAYNNTDTFFIPYIDTRETTGTDGTPGSEVVSLTYTADRSIVLEARNVENATQIVPFKTTGSITSSGLTLSVIRTEDTVYT